MKTVLKYRMLSLLLFVWGVTGQAAALKVLPMLLERGLEIQLVAFPGGEDDGTRGISLG